VVFLLVAVVVAGAIQLAPVKASTCPTPKCHGSVCPYIVAPVRCPDGCTYINGCYASCAGERNCVPYGGF
jgi:hypothetical protein